MTKYLETRYYGLDYSVFLPFCHPEYHAPEAPFGHYIGPYSIMKRCINGKHAHNHVLDYVKEFWSNYKDFGKVVHIPMLEAHEGTGEVMLNIDEDITRFLQ